MILPKWNVQIISQKTKIFLRGSTIRRSHGFSLPANCCEKKRCSFSMFDLVLRVVDTADRKHTIQAQFHLNLPTFESFQGIAVGIPTEINATDCSMTWHTELRTVWLLIFLFPASLCGVLVFLLCTRPLLLIRLSLTKTFLISFLQNRLLNRK